MRELSLTTKNSTLSEENNWLRSQIAELKNVIVNLCLEDKGKLKSGALPARVE